MSKIKCICLFFGLMSNFTSLLNATTLVYNLRIRRSFSKDFINNDFNKKKPWLFTSVPLFYLRYSHIIDKQKSIDVFDSRHIVGSVFNLKYTYAKSWWLEATTGLENEYERVIGTTNFVASKTGIDDLVVHGGYNIMPTKAIQLVFYGLAGFPLNRKVKTVDTFDPLIGTRFFSLGLGSEFSYSVIREKKRSLAFIFQNRLIHFFNRKWFPILPCNSKIKPGNVADLLFVLQYRLRKNVFDVGYNATFFTNVGVITQEKTIKSPNFLRNSIYGGSSKLFKKLPIIKTAGAIGAGFSFAKSKKFNSTTYIFWLNFSSKF